MKLECKSFGALCELEIFTINGIEADYHDFGTKEDIDHESAEPYGCGNMKFIPKEPSQEVLDTYKITEDEYDLICEKLEIELSFGHCGWCI